MLPSDATMLPVTTAWEWYRAHVEHKAPTIKSLPACAAEQKKRQLLDGVKSNTLTSDRCSVHRTHCHARRNGLLHLLHGRVHRHHSDL